jgi:UDP-2-acetamido-2-deoxy-ribo-hexuluronate aminotransferase
MEQTTAKKTIPFIDLHAQQERIRPQIEERIKKVLDHGKYIMGPEIAELEQRLVEFVGTQHCVTCASGTDALLMPLLAYEIGPGDAIFTTPFTFISTAEVVNLLGATPVFADIEADTYNIDTAKLRDAIEQVVSEGKLKPKGIIPVDLFGQPADYEEIEQIAREFGLFVIEDAAQAFGAKYKNKPACSFGDVGATSFFPAKPFGCYGDGGAIFCNDDGMAQKLRSVRIHGQGSNKYDNIRIGINGRFDAIQAAVLLAKLEIFKEEIELRNQVANRYSQGLKDSVVVPVVKEDRSSVWAQYSILAKNRENLINELKSKGIPTAIYYPKPLHLQPAYQSLGYRNGDFPISERIANQILSIPMHPYLNREDQDFIIEAINEAAS